MESIKLNKYFDISKIITIENINEMEQILFLKEYETTGRIEELMMNRLEMKRQMKIIGKKLENLKSIELESEKFANIIKNISFLAEDVSAKVRQLDKMKNHVSSCQQRVNDLLDLQQCSEGVATAMQNEDYEKAAAHVHRFLTMDETLLKHTTMDISEGQTLDASFLRLHDAEYQLKKVVSKKFDEAIYDEDLASVERFFKIFPLINMHDDGLKRFTNYLIQKLSDISLKNLAGCKMKDEKNMDRKRVNIIYADTLTLLFEGIARIIEIHQPLIETYYGPGRIYTVIEYLQKECDIQCKLIIDEFKINHDFKYKIGLIISFMNQKINESKLNPKELDLILNELTLLNARTELYSRFIKRRILNDIEVSIIDENEKKMKILQLERFIIESETFRIIQSLLGQYILLEQFFMAESVQKAVEMDKLVQVSGSDTFLLSSITDDVFFIIKKCIKRSLSSQNVDGICAVINNACGILESDFADLLLQHLRHGFPSGYLDLAQAYTLLHHSFQQGKLQASDMETNRTQFIAYLNSTDISMEYVTSLKSALDISINESIQLTIYEKEKISNCLNGLISVNIRLKSVYEFGFLQLKSSAVKPRIKPWLDVFFHIRTTYELDDDEYIDDNTPAMQTFISDLDIFLQSFKICLSTNTFESFVVMVTTEIVIQIEKAIYKIKFNRIGGLQFDKELRILISYLSNLTTWSIRDKFTRLTQITILLTLEKVSEMMDYWGKGPITWRLTIQEVRLIMGIRSDFRPEDIKRLKL